MERKSADNDVAHWSSTGNPRRKIYFDTSAGIPVQDIWYDFRDTRNQNVYITGYPTEKNPALIERIIRASSNPGDLVLDCFCGSGTTLAVADMLGRNWIGIDTSHEAISATLRRFIHGTERMGDFVQRDRDAQHGAEDEEHQLALFTDDAVHGGNLHTRKITNFALLSETPYAAPSVAEWLNLLVE